MYLRYEIKGTVDKNLSRNLSVLKQQGYPVEKKMFPDLGRARLAGEHPGKPPGKYRPLTDAHWKGVHYERQ